MEEVIVIVGPTCSGKTYLSLLLAEYLDTEIISADSRQIFRLLDIGTAKPSVEQLRRVKHHFIDDINPDDDFNVSTYAKKSETIIRNLFERKKIPIVVGGSGLYIKSLIDGISKSADTNEYIRTELLELRLLHGNEFLYNELKKVDEISAEKMLPQNWKRVIRALEVFRLTCKPIWYHHVLQTKSNSFHYNQIGLQWDRKLLYQKIEKRVDKMIEDGLVNEVKEILTMGYSKSINSLNTVGYKEIIQYLENEISFERSVELIKRNTRRYAKRQITWFNADKRINWTQIESEKDLDLLAKNILKEVNEREN